MLTSRKGKSSEKGQKCICPLFEFKKFLHCKCILATLLQNRAQYLNIFVLSKILNFALLVHPLVWFTMDLQTDYLEDRYHERIILLLLFTMKFFCTFFWINYSNFFFLFAFWRKKIRRHLVKVFLLQVVFCKV